MLEKEIVAYISRAIELGGVIILVVGVIAATARYVFWSSPDSDADLSPYRQYRRDIGRGILLGLEVLVAADIVSTVTISPTLDSVFVLAMVVLVRTFLSVSIELEIEGRFPWQKKPQSGVEQRS